MVYLHILLVDRGSWLTVLFVKLCPSAPHHVVGQKSDGFIAYPTVFLCHLFQHRGVALAFYFGKLYLGIRRNLINIYKSLLIYRFLKNIITYVIT